MANSKNKTFWRAWFAGVYIALGIGTIGVSAAFGFFFNIPGLLALGYGLFRYREHHILYKQLRSTQNADQKVLDRELLAIRGTAVALTVVALAVSAFVIQFEVSKDRFNEDFQEARAIHLAQADQHCADDEALFDDRFIPELSGVNGPVLISHTHAERLLWEFPNISLDREPYVEAVGTDETPGTAQTLLCFEWQRGPQIPRQSCDGETLEALIVRVEVHSLTDERSGLATTESSETCAPETQTIEPTTSPTDDRLLELASEALANME